MVSIDGTTGEVFLGAVPVTDSPVLRHLEGTATADETDGLVEAVAFVMDHADGVRRMEVRANADTAEDAARARRFGASGIGLCRTEHMFLGPRRELVERLILATDEAAREAALAELLPLQRQDFTEILREMDGLPVTIRLIDPPLHEFLPDHTELAVQVALEDDHGDQRDERHHTPARRRRPAARAEPHARAARRPPRHRRPRPGHHAGPCRARGRRRPARRPAATPAPRS